MLLQKFKWFLASARNTIPNGHSQGTLFFARVSKEQYPKTDISNACERNKVMRGLDYEGSAQTMLDGMRIYYNFIRPHMALNGKTPAEESKITTLEQNKWEGLIKKSTKRQQ